MVNAPFIRGFYIKKAPVIIQRTDKAVVPPHFVRISQTEPLRVRKIPLRCYGRVRCSLLEKIRSVQSSRSVFRTYLFHWLAASANSLKVPDMPT